MIQSAMHARLRDLFYTDRETYRREKHVIQRDYNWDGAMADRHSDVLPQLLDCPRMKYKPREYRCCSVVHSGQRKLQLSELPLLLESEPGDLVVYAGAAPGDHLAKLARWFPSLEFHLYDPRSFSPKLYPCPNVKLCPYESPGNPLGFFDDHLAEYYARGHSPRPGQRLLFVSDIRQHRPTEEQVRQNMLDQQRWVRTMKPELSMLKFRFPFGDIEPWNYLDGDLYLPVWGRPSTTECRLLVAKEQAEARGKTYDPIAHEEQMMYFNHVTRITTYNYEPNYGYCCCFDCCSEQYWLQRLAEKIHRPLSDLIRAMNER